MHVDLADIAVVRPSVRLSIRPSVTLMYRGRMCFWVSSKIITTNNYLRVFAPRSHNIASGTPLKFGWNRGVVAVLRKPAISLKRGKIEPRLLCVCVYIHIVAKSAK